MSQLDHVGLSVADIDAEAAWYAQALGLRPVDPGSVPALGIRVVFLVHPEHGWAIELLQRTGSRPGQRPTSAPEALLTQGYGHICLRVADVDAAHDALVAAGAASIGAPGDSPAAGVRMAFVADPEGHLIELIDRPGIPGTPVDAS